LATAAVSGVKGDSAEIHRLRVELAGRLPYPDPAKTEDSFRTALAIAREQGTRGYELRAATSLARLWRGQGRRAEARDLLAPVYGWFTEGFDSADLKTQRYCSTSWRDPATGSLSAILTARHGRSAAVVRSPPW
jgi:predicted ATPase